MFADGGYHRANRYEIGDANLKSEYAIQIDISYVLTRNSWELYINPFFYSIQYFIQVVPNGRQVDDLYVYEYKQDDSKLYRIDTSLLYSINKKINVNFNLFSVFGNQINNRNLIPLQRLGATF